MIRRLRRERGPKHRQPVVDAELQLARQQIGILRRALHSVQTATTVNLTLPPHAEGPVARDVVKGHVRYVDLTATQALEWTGGNIYPSL
jgi:hypothetical protein